MRHLRVDDSSNVTSLTWADGKLDVEFKSGAVYRYSHVQLHQLGEAAAAESVGKWVSTTLVRNPTAYPFVKMHDETPAGQSRKEQYRTALELIASAGGAWEERATLVQRLALEVLRATR